MESQMKRGILEMCLLWMIASEEAYGYRLLKEMAEIFPDQQERTTYAILRRLLGNGYTETFSKHISVGPPRKYYRITDAGRQYLSEVVKDWNRLTQSVEIWELNNPTQWRPCFFIDARGCRA